MVKPMPDMRDNRRIHQLNAKFCTMRECDGVVRHTKFLLRQANHRVQTNRSPGGTEILRPGTAPL